MDESFLVLFYKKERSFLCARPPRQQALPSFFCARPPRQPRAQAILFEKRSKNFSSGYR